MWHKIDYKPNITKYFRYQNSTKKTEGEPQPDLEIANCKAVYVNSSPKPLDITPPPAGGSGKYQVHKKWKFETIGDAINFAERYVVPYAEQTRIEEVSIWGYKNEGTYTRYKRYKDEKTARRYGKVAAEAPDVPDDVYLVIIHRQKGDNPVYMDLGGSYILKDSDGNVLGSYLIPSAAERAAKASKGYDEVWVCQS